MFSWFRESRKIQQEYTESLERRVKLQIGVIDSQKEVIAATKAQLVCMEKIECLLNEQISLLKPVELKED